MLKLSNKIKHASILFPWGRDELASSYRLCEHSITLEYKVIARLCIVQKILEKSMMPHFDLSNLTL